MNSNSFNNIVSSIEPRQYKYLFVASYFNVNDIDNFPNEVKPFVNYYLKNNFAMLDKMTLLKFVDYLTSINLRHVIVDKNINMFRYIKPQFKFVCLKNNLDIMTYDDKVYVQPETPIYATNCFVGDPSKFRVMMYSEFSKVVNDRHFVNNSDTHCVINGSLGYVFESTYLDWCGVRMCSANGGRKEFIHAHPFRLYLIGDLMAKHFVDNNIAFVNTEDYVLKNFYKGLPLFRTNYRIINNKKYSTRKPNVVFDELRTELDTNSSYVKFIQRDYIYDADFPEDLLDLLNEYMTDTAMLKVVKKFDKLPDNETKRLNLYNEIIVDRFAVNRYRKINIKIEPNTRFPALRATLPSYLMVRPDIIQIKGTLNSFYVPKMRLFAILAENALFGATELLTFSPSLIQYAHHSPPKRLKTETFVVDKTQKLYLSSFLFGGSVPAYLLIRGDYESADSSFKSLGELNNNWVKNSLLKLLITTELIDRSLELGNYNLRSGF
ncbi:P49 [Trabala vishnou gigantina nucleopolyhedrovirus]|uniref:P49 n=1 Tax=Trabala vishnou gigantina nucleopolyhedrovirus TaxID=2863583 RepID=UPI002481D29E|nr:P49 [Trabala vishnou gigantina nucleopolyhedrovirus]QYC92671.1 P49 [Trabala vishnou gigantina nucleopolyhedrovirus]